MIIRNEALKYQINYPILINSKILRAIFLKIHICTKRIASIVQCIPLYDEKKIVKEEYLLHQLLKMLFGIHFFPCFFFLSHLYPQSLILNF